MLALDLNRNISVSGCCEDFDIKGYIAYVYIYIHVYFETYRYMLFTNAFRKKTPFFTQLISINKALKRSLNVTPFRPLLFWMGATTGPNWTKTKKSGKSVVFSAVCSFFLPLIGRKTLTSNRIWKRKQTGKAGSSKFFLANFVCSLAKEGSGRTSHLMTNYVTDVFNTSYLGF